MILSRFASVLASAALFTAAGCKTTGHFHRVPGDLPHPQKAINAPHELAKVVQPAYRVEPPDILSIEAIRLVPNANYTLSSRDSLTIRVQRTSLEQLAPNDVVGIRVPGAPVVSPIDGAYPINIAGYVSLGPPYGAVRIGGLTLKDAETAIETHLAEILVAPKTSVSIVEFKSPVDASFTIDIDGMVDFGAPYGRLRLEGLTLAGSRDVLTAHFESYFSNPAVSVNLIETSFQQYIAGEHLVGPDGMITLGSYGSVSVVGLTLDETRWAIEAHLSQYLNEPSVAVSVFSYNSKVYYIVTEGGGFGDQVYRFPVTGNDTVLDALALINGLTEVSSSRMWIARPTPVPGNYEILPVNWRDLTSLAAAETNYQLMPGDRLFVAQDSLVAFDRTITKLTRPLERMMGFSILGATTATRLSGKVLEGGGNPQGSR